METLRRLSAISLIVALVFAPLYPLQVMAQEAIEEAPVEEMPIPSEQSAESSILDLPTESDDSVQIGTGDATA